jgi:hypothetical protein
MLQRTATEPRFALWLANTAYPVALAVRTISQVLPDADAAQYPSLRISAASGADSRYPAAYLVPLDWPPGVQEACLKAAYGINL